MKRSFLIVTIVLLAALLVGLTAVALSLRNQPVDPTLPSTAGSTAGTTVPSTAAPTTEPSSAPTTEPTAEPTTVPTEPPIVKETTATIGATGDILMHDLLIASGYDRTAGTYNYDDIFTWFSSYVSRVDYAVANLEVTLAGADNGYDYGGYPNFNCPDAIVDSLKAAGFDMLLTANNHSYDTRHTGFIRTQQVIDDRGLDRIGTRLSTDVKRYSIVDINGIRIGMVNYTYNTGIKEDGSVSLNVIPLTLADSQLVNSFSYDHLDSFYAELGDLLVAMKAEGAEATVLYIHWGDEYKTAPNSNQTKMAQELCNMGIDVIVGNHAHVPQPVELLTSQLDGNQKTLCLYSTGNSVSNIYETSRFPVNTEDGMLFTFSFAKYSDGTVVLEGADVLPTWVWRHDVDGVRKFDILTLDDEIADWKSHLGVSDQILAECRDSYERTMDIVGEGLEEANAWLTQHQAEVEAQLGIE